MITAVIVASGKGLRAGGGVPKQYIEICGRPLLYYTIQAFEDSCADSIVLVVAEEYLGYVRENIVEKYGFNKVNAVVAGGAERYDSVLAGLKAAPEITDIVLIHDGARPFVNGEIISNVIDAVRAAGAAIAAMPVKDTIDISDGEDFILRTTDRSRTWQVQTPQGFYLKDISQAYEMIIGSLAAQKQPDIMNGAAADADQNMNGGLSASELSDKDSEKDIGIPERARLITDDASVYRMAFPDRNVRLVKGSYENIKITTPEDVEFAGWKISQRH